MIQAPIAPIGAPSPVNAQQPPRAYVSMPQANYNAVKIDIHNPHVNTPGSQQNAVQEQTLNDPIYTYPQQSVYEVPKQSIYEPKKEVAPTSAVSEAPTVPPPVIVPTKAQPETTTAPTAAPAPADAAAKKVEIQEPQNIKPQLDVNEFISKLNSPDYDVQAKTMEAIAQLAQNQPQSATELLDVKVIDTLLGIMNKDSSKLEGPTAKQLEIREKILSGKSVTEAETAEANKITPMEQSERNKQFAIYTTAILQKLYGAEIEKMNKTVVPMTELPGAAGIVEQIKVNPNPMVRAAGIDALSYIQRPEYKQDLTTIFTVAQKDKDVNVQKAATKALEKLAQVAQPAEAKPAPKTDAKPEVKKA